jgi:hypothetical protein
MSQMRVEVIRVRIGDVERDYQDVDAQWVHQQVHGWTSEHGRLPCVQVTVNVNDFNLIAQTLATCGAQVVSGRPGRPSDDEQRVFERWNRLKMNEEKWTSGNLTAFLQELDRIV